jgi:hypothetical protein
VSVSVESSPTQGPPGSWTPARGQPPAGMSDADVIAFAIAACESLLDAQTFGPLERFIDVRRDVPPEVLDGQEADYKSAVFTVTSCLAHTVGLRPLPRDLEVLLRQGMAAYPGHRPSPELLANEMRRAAMRLSIAVPDSLQPSVPLPAVSPRLEPAPAPAEPATAPPEPAPAPPSIVVDPEAAQVVAPVRVDEPPSSPPREPAGRRRRLFAAALGVALVAGVLSFGADRMLERPNTTGRPATAHGSTGVDLRVRKIAMQPGPNGQMQVKIAPSIDSGLSRPMTLPFGPGAKLLLLTGTLPGAWMPSVTPRSGATQLSFDASSFGGSNRSGSITGIPPNPVSSPSTFTGADGTQHQTMVSTMKDHSFAVGATMTNRSDRDVLVYDVPQGTSVLALALIGDDGFVIASTLRASMPAPSAGSSF